jgi:hypothetical protein
VELNGGRRLCEHKFYVYILKVSKVAAECIRVNPTVLEPKEKAYDLFEFL